MRLGELELLGGAGVELHARAATASDERRRSEKPERDLLGAWRRAPAGSSATTTRADERDQPIRMVSQGKRSSSLASPTDGAEDDDDAGEHRQGVRADVAGLEPAQPSRTSPPISAASPPTAPSTPVRVGEDQRRGSGGLPGRMNRPSLTASW